MVKTYTKSDFARDIARRPDFTAYWLGRILGFAVLVLVCLGIAAVFKFVVGYLLA